MDVSAKKEWSGKDEDLLRLSHGRKNLTMAPVLGDNGHRETTRLSRLEIGAFQSLFPPAKFSWNGPSRPPAFT